MPYVSRRQGYLSLNAKDSIRQCKKPGCKNTFKEVGTRRRKYCDTHSAYIKIVGK